MVIVAIFLMGFFLTGLIGTSTAMTFIWPAYLLLGLASLLSIGGLFKEVSFKMPLATTVSIFALIAYFLIRAADSPVAYFAREDAALIVSGFMVYAGFLMLCSNGQLRRGLILTLTGLVVINMLMALAQKVISPSIWIIPGYERSHTGVGGLFNQPDHFASFIASTTPLWFGFAAFGRHEGRKRLAWLALGILCVGVVLFSGSMIGKLALGAGMIALFTLCLTVLWNRLKPEVRRRGLVGLVLATVVGAGALFLTSGQISEGLSAGLSARSSESSLSPTWDASINQTAESPWLGTGSRSSYIYGRAFRSEALESKTGKPEFAHNEFFQVLADYGIIGLALTLALVIIHFQNGMTFVKAYSEVKPPLGGLLPRSHHLALAIGAMASVVSLSSLAFFDFMLHLPAFAMLGAVLLAVMAVPDPMSAVLDTKKASTLPGGGLVFATRAIAFGCGVAMVGIGALFFRAEYHYEMARVAFELDSKDFKPFRHLQTARALDPVNPFAYSLSAHAQVAGITSQMSPLERRQALEKADFYFSEARRLYPKDVFAAVGHAAVLDELGKRALACERLKDARKWAPRHGNLMLAEAEHYLRHGEGQEAKLAFENAMNASAFRDYNAALEGFKAISEWKLIAEQDVIDWNNDPQRRLASNEGRRNMGDARIERRTLGGEAEEEQVVEGAAEETDSSSREFDRPIPVEGIIPAPPIREDSTASDSP